MMSARTHRSARPDLLGLLLGFLAVCLSWGCKSENAATPDARVDLPVADQQAHPDTLQTRDIGMPDSDPTSKIFVILESPQHLSTGHLATFKPGFRITLQNYFQQDDGLAVASKQLALLALPERTPVDGAWIPRNGSATTTEFTPVKPLAMDKEYLIQATPTALVQVNREKTVFRVGSLPRVVGISFGSTNMNQVYDGFTVHLSEGVPTSTFFAAVTVSLDGKPLALTLKTTSTFAATLALALPGGFDLQKVYTIEVAPDVGASKKLDSDYQGKESTTAFKLAIKAGDYLNDKAWTPNLSY